MKKLIVAFGMLLALIFSVSIANPARALVTSISVSDATNVTFSSATFEVQMNTDRTQTGMIVAVSLNPSFSDPNFVINTDCSLQNRTHYMYTAHYSIDAGIQSRSIDLTGYLNYCGTNLFEPSTRYYYKAGLTDGRTCNWDWNCYTWSSAKSFVTSSATGPSIGAIGVSGIGSTSAMVSADVVANDVPSTATVVYSTNADLSDSNSVKIGTFLKSSNSATKSVGITGLFESSKYFYRVNVTSQAGNVSSAIKSFTTKAPIGISIENAAEFTNIADVQISVSWPANATKLILANDGGFRDQKVLNLSETVSWKLVSSGNERLPKNIYAKFVYSDGTRSSVMTDDIILDTSKPILISASLKSISNASGGVFVSSLGPLMPSVEKGVKVSVKSSDSNSGVRAVEIKGSANGKSTTIEMKIKRSSTTSFVLKTSKKRFWLRVVDAAGNKSSWKSVSR